MKSKTHIIDSQTYKRSCVSKWCTVYNLINVKTNCFTNYKINCKDTQTSKQTKSQCGKNCIQSV